MKLDKGRFLPYGWEVTTLVICSYVMHEEMNHHCFSWQKFAYEAFCTYNEKHTLTIVFLNLIVYGQKACKSFFEMRHIKRWGKSHPVIKCCLTHGSYRINRFYFVNTYLLLHTIDLLSIYEVHIRAFKLHNWMRMWLIPPDHNLQFCSINLSSETNNFSFTSTYFLWFCINMYVLWTSPLMHLCNSIIHIEKIKNYSFDLKNILEYLLSRIKKSIFQLHSIERILKDAYSTEFVKMWHSFSPWDTVYPK